MAKPRKPIVAIMYDFDKTLSTKDMQEFDFIPALGETPSEFWSASNDLAVGHQMDRILAYMYLMLKKAKDKGEPLTKNSLMSLGRGIQFYPGVEEWFERINAYGKKHGVVIEHYVISSGVKEIIEGSSIAKYFKAIYACEYFYDENGEAIWPKQAVNYTNKTQYLFRINKGVLDVYDDETLNGYVVEDERRVPFRNMIYIGDGLTDVPCMKLVKLNHGQSVAVFRKRDKGMAKRLIAEGRVDFITIADYTAEGELDHIVEATIEKIAVTEHLKRMHLKHKKAR